MNMRIRKLSLKDLDQLQNMARRTFAETFADTNTPENMARYTEQRLSLEQLQTELCNPESEFYFAEAETPDGVNLPLGYLKLNFANAQTELQDKDAVEIERIYVLQEYHGSGAGQILLQKARERALEHSAAYLWLGVWENNHRALRFYTKNGFAVFDKHIFKMGNEDQTDLMMKLNLKRV